jgi:hypothetical protein
MKESLQKVTIVNPSNDSTHHVTVWQDLDSRTGYTAWSSRLMEANQPEQALRTHAETGTRKIYTSNDTWAIRREAILVSQVRLAFGCRRDPAAPGVPMQRAQLTSFIYTVLSNSIFIKCAPRGWAAPSYTTRVESDVWKTSFPPIYVALSCNDWGSRLRKSALFPTAMVPIWVSPTRWQGLAERIRLAS